MGTPEWTVDIAHFCGHQAHPLTHECSPVKHVLGSKHTAPSFELHTPGSAEARPGVGWAVEGKQLPLLWGFRSEWAVR